MNEILTDDAFMLKVVLGAAISVCSFDDLKRIINLTATAQDVRKESKSNDVIMVIREAALRLEDPRR